MTHIKKKAIFACAIFALALMSGEAFAETSPMVGDWFAEGVENGMHAQFIIHNNADDSFTKDLRSFSRCNVDQAWSETGTWSFDGKNYVEVTRTVAGDPVDSSQSEYNDSFAYTPGDGQHFTMYDPKTGITWTMTHVPSDYQFPPAEGCTV